METFVTRKGILRPVGAEDKRESGANPGQFPLLYALYAAGESSSHCPAGDGKAACGSVRVRRPAFAHAMSALRGNGACC